MHDEQKSVFYGVIRMSRPGQTVQDVFYGTETQVRQEMAGRLKKTESALRRKASHALHNYRNFYQGYDETHILEFHISLDTKPYAA